MISDEEVVEQNLTKHLLEKIENEIIKRLQKGEETLYYNSDGRAHDLKAVTECTYQIVIGTLHDDIAYLIDVIRTRRSVIKFWKTELQYSYHLTYSKFRNRPGSKEIILRSDDSDRIQKIYLELAEINKERSKKASELSEKHRSIQLKRLYQSRKDEIDRL